MGLAAIDYILHCNRRPKFLVVTDISDERLNRAESLLGKEEAAKNNIEIMYVNTASMEDPVAYLRSLTGDKGYDDVLDDYVVTANINTVGSLDIDEKNISDLTGIEDFLALRTLYCSDNKLSSINVINITGLEYFSCDNNNLSSLDVSNNTLLTSLECEDNQISSLDVSNNTQLTWLVCNENNLTSLDVSNNILLTGLACEYNQISFLDVSNNTELTWLVCKSNQISNLDVSNNTALTSLSCGAENMTDLDVSKNIELGYLAVIRSNLSSLDVSKNTKLTKLYCWENNLSSLDLSNNPLLEGIYCSSNHIENLELTTHTMLKYLICYGNDLTELDVSNNPALVQFSCGKNPLNSLNVKNGNNTSITFFHAMNCPDLYCIQVDDAEWSNANWTNKDERAAFREDCSMAYTYIPDYNFEQALIDLGYDALLDNYVITASIDTVISLDISTREISDLTGIQDFAALKSLDCDDNSLMMLNVNTNAALISLSCEGNNLKTLSIKNGNNLNFIYYNSLNNPELFCIEVDDANYSTENWTSKDAHASFSEDCNYFTWVPDDNFEQELIDLGYDDYLDDYVLTRNIDTVETLEIPSMNISDLTGIESFIALKYLDCSDNNISSLDVSSMIELINFNCSKNNLSTLDISSNTDLMTLKCYNNNLNALDTESNTALTYLSCATNNLSALELSNNTDLVYLYCDYNNLGSLDVSSNTDLVHLTCDENNLSALDLTLNTELEALYCNLNEISSLDVSNNILLEYLYCGYNNLTSLDVSSNSTLADLGCNNNQLTILETKYNVALKNLLCDYNLITELDLRSNPQLVKLDCEANNLTNLFLKNNPALTSLSCGENDLTYLNVKNGNNSNITLFNATDCPDLYCIEVDDAAWSTASWTEIDAHASFSEDCYPDYTYIPDKNFEQALIDLDYDDVIDYLVLTSTIADITTLQLSTNGINDLTGIEDFTNLYSLDCSFNHITSLDVSNNAALTRLFCNYNQITYLDLSNNGSLELVHCENNNLSTLILGNQPGLASLVCYGNQLNSIDLANCPELNYLEIQDNQLTSLDISQNPLLLDLTCSENQISTLDLKNNTILMGLNCSQNLITRLDVSNNLILESIQCSGNQISSLDVSNLKKLGTLYCSYNQITTLNTNYDSALVTLICNNNAISQVDFSTNTSLANLEIYDNQLTYLDLSNNSSITRLLCYNNNLTGLNLKNGTNVNMANTNFRAINNPDLYCIKVDDAAWSTANWTHIDSQSYFSEYCGDLPLSISISVDKSNGFVPLTVNFTSAVEGGVEPYTYLWNFGDETTSTESNPAHTFETTGNFMVIATVTDMDESTDSDTLYIDVAEATFMLSGAAYNEDGTMAITAGSVELYAIDEPEPFTETALTGEGLFNFTQLDAGSYIIKVTPDNISFPDYLPTYSGMVLMLNEAEPINLESDTDGADILCRMKPQEGSGEGKIDGKVLTSDGSGKFKMAYGSEENGTPISEIMVYLTGAESKGLEGTDITNSEGEFSFNGLEDGQYDLLVDYKGIPMSDENNSILIGSEDRDIQVSAIISENKISVSLISGIENFKQEDGAIYIYPNPAIDFLIIQPMEEVLLQGNIRAELFTTTGKKIIDTNNRFKMEASIEMDLQPIPSGSYYLRVTCGSIVFHRILIIAEK